MFDSKVTAEKLISDLNDTLDVAVPIPVTLYIAWLNELEQFLYTEIIKEQREYTEMLMTESVLPLAKISVGSDADKVRFGDVIAVYALGDTATNSDEYVQLIETTIASKHRFKNVYYADGDSIRYSYTPSRPSLGVRQTDLRVVYVVRPKLKDGGNISELSVMLPPEFMGIARAKLSGEAYKWVNEDAIAAKWLNDYNILLETFKQWMAAKNPSFGWRA